MLRIEVNSLIGTALDWAVAKYENLPVKKDPMGFITGSESGYWVWDQGNGKKPVFMLVGREYSPSTIWELGGPVLEKLRERSNDQFWIESDGSNVHVMSWVSEHQCFTGYGPTLLVAAMRCFVAVHAGSEIDVPESLAPPVGVGQP